jgi:hypothetical protein
MEKQPDEEQDGNELQHKYRIRQDMSGLVEDIIADGRNRGAFDNLKGKGKPLNLNKPVFGADKELAHRLLQDNEMQPVWIMQRNDILAKQSMMRAQMERVWSRHEQSFHLAKTADERGRLTISWDDACLRWTAEIEKLNKDIGNYNLKRPSANLEIFRLNLEKELEKLGAPRWLR